jgi:sporulation protein YlmC with PRC-barrel domain
MDVVRDLLDKLVVDRNGREMGRVDGIVLEQRDGVPPRLMEILIGPTPLAERLHPRLGRFVHTVEARLGLADGRPVRIDFADVEDFGRAAKLSVAIGETAVEAVEQRLRGWVAKIPGSR